MSSERLTTSTGTAKPTPSPPPEVDLICWLTPITRPSPSTSGPPELPGLIAASVWIAPEMLKLVSDCDRAVDRGDHADRERLLLAERGADRRHRLADLDARALAERQRAQLEALGVDLEQRDVRVRVGADDLGLDLVAVGELDVDLLRAPDRLALAGGDHVGVGGDLALAVEHEAGAHPAAALARRARRRPRTARRRSPRRAPRSRRSPSGRSRPPRRSSRSPRRAWSPTCPSRRRSPRPRRLRRRSRPARAARSRIAARLIPAAPARRSSSPARTARSGGPACAPPARARSPARGRRPAPPRWR